jgi:F0F1-type ATP synthase assembly protein I
MAEESGPGGPDRGMAQGHKYFAVGLRFAGGVVAFTLGGYALDRWLTTIPLFTIVGTIGGAALSFLSVYRQLIFDARRESRVTSRETREDDKT